MVLILLYDDFYRSSSEVISDKSEYIDDYLLNVEVSFRFT